MTRRPFRRLKVRVSLAQQRRNVRAAINALVIPEKLAKFEADFPIENYPERARRTRTPQAQFPGVDIAAAHKKQPPLEKEVLSAVGDLLAKHPRVSYALRVNSGMASYEAASGRYAPVYFHKWIRSPVECKMPDYFGALVDGRTVALECKRPGWKKPTDKREYAQAAFLMLIRNLGGIGEFVTSADEVASLLA